jgi:hypothetical protein
MKALAGILLGLALLPTIEAQNRNVNISWVDPQAGVTFTVSRGTATTGPFTQLASGITALSYVDATAVIGSTYTYQVVAVAVPCTSTTAVAAVCGSSPSAPATATTSVPQQPTVVSSITLVVP